MVPTYGFQGFHQDARLRLHVPCCNERNVGVETPVPTMLLNKNRYCNTLRPRASVLILLHKNKSFTSLRCRSLLFLLLRDSVRCAPCLEIAFGSLRRLRFRGLPPGVTPLRSARRSPSRVSLRSPYAISLRPTQNRSLKREGPGKAYAAIPKQLTYAKPERIDPNAYVSTGLFLFWFVFSFCLRTKRKNEQRKFFLRMSLKVSK